MTLRDLLVKVSYYAEVSIWDERNGPHNLIKVFSGPCAIVGSHVPDDVIERYVMQIWPRDDELVIII